MLQLPATLDATYNRDVNWRFKQSFGTAVTPWSGPALEGQFLTRHVSR